MLPEGPTPALALEQGEEICAAACVEPRDREQMLRRALYEYELPADSPYLHALVEGEPVRIAVTWTTPQVRHLGVPDDDVLDASPMYAKAVTIDAEGLPSHCLYRLGREKDLTHERACSKQERAQARETAQARRR